MLPKPSCWRGTLYGCRLQLLIWRMQWKSERAQLEQTGVTGTNWETTTRKLVDDLQLAESAVVDWTGLPNLDITVIDSKCTQSSWSCLWLVSHWLMVHVLVLVCAGNFQTHSLHAIHARHNTCRYKMHTTHTIYVTYTLPQSSQSFSLPNHTGSLYVCSCINWKANIQTSKTGQKKSWFVEDGEEGPRVEGAGGREGAEGRNGWS